MAYLRIMNCRFCGRDFQALVIRRPPEYCCDEHHRKALAGRKAYKRDQERKAKKEKKNQQQTQIARQEPSKQPAVVFYPPVGFKRLEQFLADRARRLDDIRFGAL